MESEALSVNISLLFNIIIHYLAVSAVLLLMYAFITLLIAILENIGSLSDPDILNTDTF